MSCVKLCWQWRWWCRAANFNLCKDIIGVRGGGERLSSTGLVASGALRINAPGGCGSDSWQCFTTARGLWQRRVCGCGQGLSQRRTRSETTRAMIGGATTFAGARNHCNAVLAGACDLLQQVHATFCNTALGRGDATFCSPPT